VKETAIDLPAFKQHYEGGRLVIDARPRDEFEAGHLNAPLVINVPSEDADAQLVRVMSCQGQPIMLYCASTTCDSAEIVWNKLVNIGFEKKDLHVYHPGWEQMQKDGLPAATGPDTHGDSICDGGGG
jgi:rhodanese-related sulfurtransferase